MESGDGGGTLGRRVGTRVNRARRLLSTRLFKLSWGQAKNESLEEGARVSMIPGQTTSANRSLELERQRLGGRVEQVGIHKGTAGTD